jgi:hypothetical protein
MKFMNFRVDRDRNFYGIHVNNKDFDYDVAFPADIHKKLSW